MKRLLIVLLLLFLFIELSAKKQYLEGFVISLNGDTISGYLQYQQSRDASRICVFKEKLSDNTKIFTPVDIKGYRFKDGKFYVSKNIDSISNKFVFLEVLVKGIASVYYYIDDNGEHYYIDKAPYGLVEITERPRYYDQSNLLPSLYKGKLKSLMVDCDNIDSMIVETKLNHQSLISLAKSYHERVCNSEACMVYEKKHYSPNFRFGIIAGYSERKYDFGGKLYSDFGQCYQIGLGLKISKISLSDDRFSINAKLLLEKDSRYTMYPYKSNVYSYALFYNDKEYQLNPNNLFGTVRDLKVHLNVINLTLPVLVNYNFKRTKYAYYVGIGLTDKIVLSQNKNYVDVKFNEQYGKTVNTVLVGGIFNIGFEKKLFGNKTFFIDCNYEYLVDPTALNQFLKLKVNQFSIQSGIYL